MPHRLSIKFNIQKVNMRLSGKHSKQYKTTFVTKIENGRATDRWVTIEAPWEIKEKLFARILAVVSGKIKLVM